MVKTKSTAVLLVAVLALGGCSNNSSPKETLYTEWNHESFMSELEESMSAEQEALEASYKSSTIEQAVSETEVNQYYEGETTQETENDQSSNPTNQNITATINEPFSFYYKDNSSDYSINNDTILLCPQVGTYSSGDYITADISGNILGRIKYQKDGRSNHRRDNNTFLIGNNLYDAYGNVIISPEKQGFDDIFTSCYKYIVVHKKEQSFEGDSHYIGVLNTNGELVSTKWCSLDFNSKDYKLAVYIVNKNEEEQDYIVISLTSHDDSIFYLYNFKTNSVVYSQNEYIGGDYNDFIIKGDNLYRRSALGSWFYLDKYNIKTGESESLFENVGVSDNINGYLFYNGYNVIQGLYDYDGNLLSDLTSYELYKDTLITSCNGDTAIFFAKGKESGAYLCFFDMKSKKMKFDPIKLYDESINGSYFSSLPNTRFFSTPSAFIYQTSTSGEFNDYFTIVDYEGNITQKDINGKLSIYDDVQNYYVSENNEELTYYHLDGEPFLIIKNKY